MEDRVWEVEIITDEHGGRTYTVTLRAPTQDEAVQLATNQVRQALAILDPLVKIIEARATPKFRSRKEP